MITGVITSAGLVLGSIFTAEIVRDLYHALAHQWTWLYRKHVWHHRVFRPDLSVMSDTIYRQAHWQNDVPEALVMLTCTLAVWALLYLAGVTHHWLYSVGVLYTMVFLVAAICRGLGITWVTELTDITHQAGQFTSIPSRWMVNRTYHWRHHFDNQDAYYCGTLTVVDKIMGTALSLKGKKIAVTGASGSLGSSLLLHLHLAGAKVVALTSSHQNLSIPLKTQNIPVKTITWEVGKETELTQLLEEIDILILNHGINVHGERTLEAIEKSYTINTFSSRRLMELFFGTVRTNEAIARKEIWVNTSEAEVNPAFSPLYELSKRALGDVVTLSRLDAPCVVRKLILGPFKSNLNPIGIMSADWVAKQIVALARRDVRNIIVTINPITWIAFPIKEFLVSNYFRWFSK